MKHENCPKCNSPYLGDRWVRERKLQQFCADSWSEDDNCGWEGEPRVPEIKKIVKSQSTLFSVGNCYEVFDRYGYTMILSRGYSSKKAAMPSILRELERGLADVHAGPYRVLWWTGGGGAYHRGVEVTL